MRIFTISGVQVNPSPSIPDKPKKKKKKKQKIPFFFMSVYIACSSILGVGNKGDYGVVTGLKAPPNWIRGA